ncbi:MAG TPA: TonB-dependent receptor plug domain-containing protein [Bacteroidales bacterium]|nr:TonB-dependent receptor plug domain-containing protein [Bacteroidales bacterium]HQH18700.1 TonB-dependent receptor plug domain-containing protein [Bacteroidales bacterium]HQI46262.1 TonB-dependent receptor plug domain-containing protein [Bacteroidales bacterium]
MSVIQIPVKQIKSLPKFMGETDVLKTFQLMPGVQGGQEGSNALYVRGGSPDQNLILLDDVPLYYVSHLGGFVSVFDANAINDIKLVKGGFPARYGGRLSSVIDIRMKDGNKNKLKREFSIGTLVSKLSLDGSLSKKTTFLISARRSFMDVLLHAYYSLNTSDIRVWYTLYDINAKICHEISEKDKLYLSFYKGGDKIGIKQITFSGGQEKLKYKDNAGIIWGNRMGALRWNHIYNQKLFGNTILSFTKFKYETTASSEQLDLLNNTTREYGQSFYSGIDDIMLKSDFDYYPYAKHKVKFGLAGTLHFFNPGISIYNQLGNDISNIDTTVGSGDLHSTESYLFLEDEFAITNNLMINAGIHFGGYFVQQRFFSSLQPRISANFKFWNDYAIKFSFATMQQPLHLLSNSGAGFPSDLWVPSTKNSLPEKSLQIALGIVRSLVKENINIEISAEGFYKKLNNLIDFQEGVSFFSPQTWENKIVKSGEGRVYGVEIFLYKKEGKWNGWTGYTYSKNMRRFDNLNNGNWFPYHFDRTHCASIVGNYEINNKISLSCAWVYETGNAITLASQKSNLINYDMNYLVSNSTGVATYSYYYDDVHIYKGRNSYRMPAYHKLDIGLNITKKVRRGIRTWNFSIYNVYNRQNAYFLFFKEKNGEIKLYQLSVFPIIPSVSYSFKF